MALAIIAIYMADIMYNALLAEVSTETNMGTIGGLGVGVGYLGSIMAVAIGLLFVESRGYAFGFRVIGVLMLLVSTPVFVLLKERPGLASNLELSERAKGALVQLVSTVGHLQRFPGLIRYFIARFWYNWFLYTSSAFAVLYGTETVGYEEREIELVLLAGILTAIPSGFVLGRVVDRVGPNRVLSVVLLSWVGVLLIAVAIPWLGLPSYLWWVIGVLAGMLVAGIWAADRPYLLRLTSSTYLGEFFGLRSMVGRLGAIVGPFSWAYISVTLGLGQVAAALSLSGCAAIAFVLIRGVGDEVPARSKEIVS